MFGPTGPTHTEQQLRRYDEDRELLQQMLPELRHLIYADGRGAVAEGAIDVDVGAGCWETVYIRVVFDHEYPCRPPRVFEVGGRWLPEADRHIMVDNEFCLWLEHVDTPTVATAEDLRDFLLRLLLFLRDQFVFDDLGRWPGRQWRHGSTAAYAQHLTEALGITRVEMFARLWPALLGSPPRPDRACPCGSKLLYHRCHRPSIERLQWVRTLDNRKQLPRAVQEHLDEAA